MEKYELLSGGVVDASTLSKGAQKHIKSIECLVQGSKDYFEVYRQAFVPLKEGKHFTAEELRQLHESAHYQISSDLVERYWQKFFRVRKG